MPDDRGTERTADAPPLSKHDGHPFEPRAGADECALCGEGPAHILHHPTRIRAACALRGLDPAPFLKRAQR